MNIIFAKANIAIPCDKSNMRKYRNSAIQKLQDEQHYPARVTALGPNTAVVMFTEYNNYEEVSNCCCSNQLL